MVEITSEEQNKVRMKRTEDRLRENAPTFELQGSQKRIERKKV